MATTACTNPVRVVILEPDGRERVAEFAEGDAGPVTVGRAPENNLQIISPYISRRHAQIFPHPEGAMFEDLSSTSGSYRHGVRVDKVVLRVGESVHLGSPDGIRLAVHPLIEEEARPAVEDSTEVLRVTGVQDSPYLTSTDRLVKAFAKPSDTKRVPSYKRMENQLRALIGLTSELLEVQDRDALADLMLAQALDQLPVERGMVLLDGPNGLEPRVWGLLGERSSLTNRTLLGPINIDADPDGSSTTGDSVLQRPELPFIPIRTVTRRVFEEGVGMLTLDAASDQRLEGSKSVVMQSIRSIMCAPISSAKKVYGVVYVDTHKALRKDHEDALEWLVAVAHQAGLVLEKIELLDQQKRMLESMMRGLAASIDARDGLTAGHSARVAHYSVGTARELGVSVEEQYSIYYAALLHDYGKIGVDDAVLKKPSQLTPEEYEHIKLHPRFTYDILSKIEFPPELAELPLMAASHHERVDGKGYPWGLAGDKIPLAGRIMAIADVYDSLTRKRHYREPMPTEEVLAHLEEGRATRFDGEVLDAFFRYHDRVLAKREKRRQDKRDKHREFGSTNPGGPSDATMLPDEAEEPTSVAPDLLRPREDFPFDEESTIQQTLEQ